MTFLDVFLPCLCKIIVIELFPARNVLNDFEEGRQFHVFILRDALGFKNEQAGRRFTIFVEFEILAFPDEASAQFHYRLPIGVGLLQHCLVEVGVDLLFRLNEFMRRHAFL